MYVYICIHMCKGASVIVKPRSRGCDLARVSAQMPCRRHNTLHSLLVLEAARNLRFCISGTRRSLKRAADSRGRRVQGEVFCHQIRC